MLDAIVRTAMKKDYTVCGGASSWC